MTMKDLWERFVEQSPVTVMARVVLEQAISAEWIDSVFEKHRQRQYTRELLFSTVVELMMMVVLGVRRSVHAAAKKAADLPVSLTALYNKLDKTEPGVMRALVQGSAERLAPVMTQVRANRAPLVPDYRIRIVDGNHLPASDKRLAVLRDWRGAALPGQSLVVFDPDQDLVVDLEPCEDGHMQERLLMRAIQDTARAGEIWIADRNFCTRPILGALAERGASFLIREHEANARPTPRGLLSRVGRVETGIVYEQPVELTLASGQKLQLRRIELRLDKPTQDGDTYIRLLTNVPGEHLDACEAACVYQKRWTIEGLFQRLESALHSEIRTLGYPPAALLAFTVAVVAYNVLSVLQAAIEASHDLDSQGVEISSYQLAEEVQSAYRGMMVAIPPSYWERFERQSPRELAQTLMQLAAHVEPKRFRKHRRKPKVKRNQGYAPRAAVQRHVATARVLRDGGIGEGR